MNSNSMGSVVLTIISVGLVMAPLTGCSGQSTEGAAGSGPSAEPIQSSEYPDKGAAAICDNIGACCTSDGFSYDHEACVQAQRKSGQELVDVLATSKNVSWDATAAGECIAKVRAVVSTCGASDADMRAVDDVCGRVIVGTVKTGEPCVDGVECAHVSGSTVYCEMEPTPGNPNDGGPAASGKCGVMKDPGSDPRSKKGEPCNMTCYGDDSSGGCSTMPGTGGEGTCWASDGLYCSNSHTCLASPEPGQACAPMSVCAVGSWCSSGTCQAQAKVGDACTGQLTPLAGECVTGAWCDTAKGICAATQPDGVSCTSGSQCSSRYCSHKGVCVSTQPITSDKMCAGK